MTSSSPSGIYHTLSRAGDEADGPLRPRSFGEFVGQERVVTNLRTWIEAARRRGGVLDHVLLSGGPGLGKTTLAHLVAADMGSQLKVTSGPALERPGDLVGAITGETGIRGGQIGSIQISERFSIVEIADDVFERVLGSLRGAKVKGKKVNVRRDKAR